MVCSFSEVNTLLERKKLDVVAPSSYLRTVRRWVVRLGCGQRLPQVSQKSHEEIDRTDTDADADRNKQPVRSQKVNTATLAVSRRSLPAIANLHE